VNVPYFPPIFLPVAARRVYAHPAVEADAGRVALACGPLVYCLEGVDTPQPASCLLKADAALATVRKPDLLGGVNVVEGDAWSRQAGGEPRQVRFTAIPFYGQDNRVEKSPIDVWIPER
jgi:DUF1680 family protein